MSDSAIQDLPADTTPPRGRACDSCGAPVEPHDKFCQSCGTPQAAPEAVAPQVLQKHIRCDNCGAEIALDPQQRSYVCPFCDSTYVTELAPKPGRQEPEFVIGFAVTPEQALDKFRTWLGQGNWFRPGDLKMAEIEDRLKGVYLPFWSFSMLAYSTWSASIGEHWYRTETYTTTENGKTVTRTRQVKETEWWDLAGQHHEYYSGYLVSASRGLEHAEAQRIQPFQLPALKRYAPSFLAGWLNEEYSVERDAAQEICCDEFRRRERDNIEKFLPGDTHRSLTANTAFSDVNSDLILLPIYLLSYRYQDKLYRFLLNGQTGKMDGDKPLSYSRIGLAVLGGLALVVLLFLLVAMLKR